MNLLHFKPGVCAAVTCSPEIDVNIKCEIGFRELFITIHIDRIILFLRYLYVQFSYKETVM